MWGTVKAEPGVCSAFTAGSHCLSSVNVGVRTGLKRTGRKKGDWAEGWDWGRQAFGGGVKKGFRAVHLT